MRTSLFLTLILSNIVLSDEVNNIAGHSHYEINQVNEVVKNLGETNQGEIVLKPKYETKTEVLPPKLRVVVSQNKPKIIKRKVNVTEEHININKKHITNNRTYERPNYIRAETKYVNKDPIYHPKKYSSENRARTQFVAGETITNQNYIQPVLTNYRENVELVQQPTIRKDLEPITKPTKYSNHNSHKHVTIPGHTVYTQDFVQPIYNSEKTNVQFTDSAPIYHDEKVVTLPTQYKNNSSSKPFTVPGRTIYQKEEHQPYHTNFSERVELMRQQPIYRTKHYRNEPRYTPTTQQTKYYSKPSPYPVFKRKYVRVPITHEIPEEQIIEVPFLMPEEGNSESSMSGMSFGEYSSSSESSDSSEEHYENGYGHRHGMGYGNKYHKFGLKRGQKSMEYYH